MSDFSQAFADLMVPMTLSRAAAGTTNDEGQYVAGSATTSTINAMPPQPVKMGELSDDESGKITRSHVKTYTAAVVLNGDLITFDGIQYRVDQSEDRRPIGGHYKVYMVRVQYDV